MAKHVTVISYTQTMNAFLEGVVLTLRGHAEHCITRCQNPTSLTGLVDQAGGRHALMLDLVGHGRPDDEIEEGRFTLGDFPLLESGKEPPEAFKSLVEVLPRDASVRLLGCYTGALIHAASAALDGRQVFGTTTLLWADDFEEHGPVASRTSLVATEGPLVLEANAAVRRERSEEDLESARRWQRLLPEEYQLTRRGRPIVQEDASRALEDARISFACARRVVLIEDDPLRPPLVLEWSGSASPPPLRELLAALPSEG